MLAKDSALDAAAAAQVAVPGWTPSEDLAPGKVTGKSVKALKLGARSGGGESSDGDAFLVENEALEKHVVVPKHAFMLAPEGAFRMSWDFLLVMPLLAYLALMTPFFVCFAWNSNRKRTPNLHAFEAFIDLAFMLDIVINFRTGYLTVFDEVEYDPGRVAQKYLTSWFAIDVCSGVPFSLAEVLLGRSGSEGGVPTQLSNLKILKMSRTARALRLFRFLKLSRVLKTAKVFKLLLNPRTKDWLEDLVEQYSDNVWVKFVQVVFLLGLLCHYMGCLWVYVGRQSVKRGAPSWFIDNGIYPDFTVKDTKHGAEVLSIYITAFYFCMTTMTSVGYGDISANNTQERAFAILILGVGCVMYALIVATLTTVIMNKDANARAMCEKLGAVSSYVRHRDFNPYLARKVRLYFRHFYTQKTGIDEKQILADCSTTLRTELSVFLARNLMSTVSVLRGLPQSYWAHMLPILRPCVFSRQELLMRQGEASQDMYVVTAGTVCCVTVVEPLIGDAWVSRSPDATHAVAYWRHMAERAAAHAVEVAEAGGGGGGGSGISDSKGAGGARLGVGVARTPRTKMTPRALKPSSFFGAGGGLAGGSGGAVSLDDDDDNDDDDDDDDDDNDDARLTITGRHEWTAEVGDSVNACGCLGLWPRSLETVRTNDTTEAYGLHADDFVGLFAKSVDGQGGWDALVARTAATALVCTPDAAAPTRWGLPLFHRPKAEAAARERDLAERVGLATVRADAEISRRTEELRVEARQLSRAPPRCDQGERQGQGQGSGSSAAGAAAEGGGGEAAQPSGAAKGPNGAAQRGGSTPRSASSSRLGPKAITPRPVVRRREGE